MAWTGSASYQDAGKLPMQDTTAVLMLVGMLLTAMSPLLLLPLFPTDARGRWSGTKTSLCIFVVSIWIILAFLTTANWHWVAPYAEKSLVNLRSAFNVAKQLPGDLVDWLQSGEGFYLLLKVFTAFAVIALFCSGVVSLFQRGLGSSKTRLKGNDVNREPRSVNREEIAASRERQQRELQEKARQKDELLRQRRLARAIEEEQRMSSWFGRGVGRYAR